MQNNLEKIFDFLKASGNLKNVYRYGDVEVLNNESTADHSWRLALMVIIFTKELDLKIDAERALKLAIIHDIAEALTGDIPANETMKNDLLKNEKRKNEIKAINRLKKILPDIHGNEIYELWRDYEYAKTEEAKFVKALDKIEAYINWIEAGYKYLTKCKDQHLIAIYPDEAVKNFPKLLPVLRELKVKLKKEFGKGGLEWKEEYNYPF
jgi:putative hydrolase of HD superfamily